MGDWTITIEAASKIPGAVTDDQLGALARELKQYAPIVTGTPTSSPAVRYGATFSYEHSFDEAARVFLDAASAAGMPDASIVRFDATASGEIGRRPNS